MSRNFELLAEAGRLQEILQSQAETIPTVAEAQPVEDTFPSAPPLEANTAVRDEVGKLAQKLFAVSEGPRRVVFAGSESDSGCSWMCARVAESLASQGRGRVCVVDCNLRSPGLHRQFGTENHHGLSEALLGNGPIREYLHRWSQNMWLLSCGASPEAGVAMLGSDRLRSRLSELRSIFDYVLIDAAPMNSCHDALVLGGLSDGVVLVLKANSSRREAARKALHDLQSANVRVLGAVLNQRTFPIPEKLYKRL
ncbi:MAG TPA: CpsD/CapB family tyrosine-protein kinase [Candidatus Sulfotelmatobacter sp.]|nr:CpsD/CapB family tyrosine-protein kinase [Candidatus Sulfotelmatobacter sp.]